MQMFQQSKMFLEFDWEICKQKITAELIKIQENNFKPTALFRL
jgi:hypothetical protein